MRVLLCPPRERQGFAFRFAANDNGAVRAARNVAPGECWAFADHRSMAAVIAAEAGR
jgi:hypothetical protein